MTTSGVTTTVILSCHSMDRWQSILDSVASVRGQQSAPEESSIVVSVDHNSELSSRLRKQLPDLEIVDNESGIRGASATRNAGARVSNAQVLAFLDDDEVADPQWLQRLVEPFGTSTNIVGTGGRYEPRWERRRPVWFPDELAWVVGGHFKGMPTTPAIVRNVWAGNMAVRSDVFHAVGGFRENFGRNGLLSQPEDTDLCIRMASSQPDGRWWYLPEAVVYHTVPSSRSGFQFFVRRCYSEGRGKVEMSRQFKGQKSLDTERQYLLHLIPKRIGHHLVSGPTGVLRAGAIVVGITAAAMGAASSIFQQYSHTLVPRKTCDSV